MNKQIKEVTGISKMFPYDLATARIIQLRLSAVHALHNNKQKPQQFVSKFPCKRRLVKKSV